jgi:hypothetical protein
MGMSQRQYAQHRGVASSTVNKAVIAKRITLEPDGTIDPAKADREWELNTEHSKRPKTQHGMKAVPRSAIEAVAETLREDGAEPAPGEGMSFMRARMANEVLKAQTARVRLAKMKGELVDKSKTTAMVFDLARRERDAWIGWPARVAANMAAELGVEAHALEHVLDRYLRKQLADMAEINLDIR